MNRYWCIISSCLVCVFSPLSVCAADSVINGIFDSDVYGWETGADATIEWNALDADGDPGSGSALIANTAESSGARGVWQCVGSITLNRGHLLKAMLRIGNGQNEAGSGYVSVWLYDQEDCYGDRIFADIGNQIHTTTPDRWLQSSLTIQATEDARSAIIWLGIAKDEGDENLSINFDNVTLRPIDSQLTFIPAAGFAAGAAGSFWETDIDVNNPTDDVLEYSLWWLPRGEDNSIPVVSETFTLAAQENNRHTNVLQSVFGFSSDDSPFGALAVEADGTSALAMARIFNQPEAGGDGTYGQAIPGVAAKQMIGVNEHRRILFLSEDDDFRSNVGCQNGTDAAIQIMMEIFDASGVSQGSMNLELAPFSNGQINRILEDWAPIIGYVDVWSTTPGAAFYCYGSVLDNVSSDPTTVLPQ